MFFFKISTLYLLYFIYSIKSQTTPTDADTTPTPEEELARKILQGIQLLLLHDYCLPSPDGIKFQTNHTWELVGLPPQNCRDLETYPALKKTNRSYYCCEVKMTAKEGKGPKNLEGCISIMKNRIDDNRYEDFIDYFKRGRQSKLDDYFVLYGKSVHLNWTQIYLPMVNNTKYDVEKFDCFSTLIKLNSFFIFAIIFFIF